MPNSTSSSTANAPNLPTTRPLAPLETQGAVPRSPRTTAGGSENACPVIAPNSANGHGSTDVDSEIASTKGHPSNRALPKEGEPWDFAFAAGPSIRFVVEAAAEGLRMTYQLPGGADLHRESQFYNNLLPRWLDNESIPFAFGPGAVENPAVELEVRPAP